MVKPRWRRRTAPRLSYPTACLLPCSRRVCSARRRWEKRSCSRSPVSPCRCRLQAGRTSDELIEAGQCHLVLRKRLRPRRGFVATGVLALSRALCFSPVPSPFVTAIEPVSPQGPVNEPVAENCSVYCQASAVSQRMSTRAMLCTEPRSSDNHSGSEAADSHREFSLPSSASDEVPAARGGVARRKWCDACVRRRAHLWRLRMRSCRRSNCAPLQSGR